MDRNVTQDPVPEWLSRQRLEALAVRADELGTACRYCLALLARNEQQFTVIQTMRDRR